MPIDAGLNRVREWVKEQKAFDAQKAVADTLLRERVGDWRGGAEQAADRSPRASDLHTSGVARAFVGLASIKPEEAQRALDAFSRVLESKPGPASPGSQRSLRFDSMRRRAPRTWLPPM